MDTLRLYIITWNLAEQMPPADLDLKELLNLNSEMHSKPDIYIIGFQEAKVDLLTGKWGTAFKNVLKEHNYVEVNCVRLLGIVTYVLAQEKHITKIRNMETGTTATGLLGIIGNKGAVTFRMDLYGASVCLVNAHLAAHDGHLSERIASYNTIVENQKFKLNEETTKIFFHDYVFWYGDLNFRLEGDSSPAELADTVAAKQLDRLWEKDELSRVRASGEAFSELTEQRPTFNPTYKHEFGKTKYSSSRRLAWTDRVLYKVNKDNYQNVTLSATQTSYNSVESYTISDHKPVYAEFDIKVFSDYSDREVSFASIDTWYLDEENSVVCHLPSDVNPSIWDWVGIFQDGLINLQDYVSYIYLPYQRDDRISQSGTNVTLRFPPTSVREPGLYRLLYFTRDASSLLGVSAPFSAIHRPGGVLTSTNQSTGDLSTDFGISSTFMLLTGLNLLFSYYFNFRLL
ncbi:inositol polyphosphate 5-phosphatase K-like isoform X2 [Macrosteles quadrilineatus]|uniref:inositol polyphosphate 5-phosphatase K-like isoform X2 n=1 Tax=Macrosteles quadrilineatus TaxID=74068 RepID=UPI0023E21C1A|nr:inositol polyphosphate 5-phosphatase K-like isoform X2 [Macrosteles quadrilineatus]